MKFALPILRTPGGSSQDVVIAVKGHLKLGTHWLAGRKHLCAGDGCPACVIDEPRWMIYVVVFHPVAGKHYLLEITERSWLAVKFLVGGRLQSNLEPGDVLSLHRKRKTSPLRVEVVDHKPEKGTHPELTTLRAVSALYSMAVPGAYDDPADFIAREAERIKFRLLAAIQEVSTSPLNA